MPAELFRLRLYVAHGAPNSVAAEANLRDILIRLGELDADIELVDVVAEPDRALEDRIMVSPTLVRLTPKPRLVLIGNLSNIDMVERMLKRPARMACSGLDSAGAGRQPCRQEGP